MTEQPATNKIRIVEKRKKPQKAPKSVEKKSSKEEEATIKSKKSFQQEIGKELSGKVKIVEPRGLTIDLDNGEEAFLPKENMHIGKKKKLEEIFSEGFIIKAKVKNKKEGKIILTQKEENTTNKIEKTQQSKKDKKPAAKKSKKTQEVKKQTQANQTTQSPKEEKEEVPQQKTLKDLKKLQSIGNMKISVGRGKKSNITKLSEEKEEVVELPKVPKGLLDNIIKSTEEATEKFSKITTDLKERNLLHVGVKIDE